MHGLSRFLLQEAERESWVCIGSGNAANEAGPVFVQADYLAESSESEQRRAAVRAALAVGGVSLGQLGLSGCWLASVGGAGFAPFVSEFGFATN